MFVDLPEPELRTYRSSQREPDNFDDFWTGTLAAARKHDRAPEIERLHVGLRTLEIYDVTFPGFDGQPVKAWLRVPAAASEPLPTIVQYQGYGGGRAHPYDDLFWASAGFAHLMMDTRGQGSSWSVGDTPDPDGGGPQIPGFMTRGIERPETYYYRRLITDGVRAVDAARSLEVVDSERVSLVGTSQGGGLALAVAGLVPDLTAVFARVPFLCDFPRATVITDNDPYKEIGRYLAVHRDKTDAVHRVLSYFDGVNFAKRAHAPAWFSAALMDVVCPPSTVFGAFNNYAGRKDIVLWPYNGHEGGAVFDDVRALDVLRGLVAPH